MSNDNKKWAETLASLQKLREAGVLQDDGRITGRSERKAAEDDPRARWLQPSAIYCDTFTVDAWLDEGNMRLVFGESTYPGSEPFYRVGIVLPIQDAIGLADLIKEAIKDAEDNRKKRAEKKESGSS